MQRQSHTNGSESLWSLLKRAYKGMFNNLSPKHLARCVLEFAGRHHVREMDTIEQLKSLRNGTQGRTVTYKARIKDNGQSSGARDV